MEQENPYNYQEEQTTVNTPPPDKSYLSVFAKREYLGLAQWIMFLAIVVTVWLSLVVFQIITADTFTRTTNIQGVENIDYVEFSSGLKIFLLILIVGFNIFPLVSLFRFSSNARKAVKFDDDFALESSIKHLRRYFKYIGILVIIFLSIFVMVYLSTGLGYLMGKAISG